MLNISDSERAIIDNILNKFVSEAKAICDKEQKDRVQFIETIKKSRVQFTSNTENSDTDMNTDEDYYPEDYGDEDSDVNAINTPHFICNVLGQEPKEMNFSEFEIHTGATRAVLVLKNLPYVIKFDFSNEIGHCDNEVDMYNNSRDYGIEMLLAESAFYSKINGIDFFIYEKVETNACDSPYSRRKYTDYSVVHSVTSSGKHCIADNMARDIYLAYDLTIFTKLCEFIEDMDLNDFHGSNYGFKGNKPVIFDYGGFERFKNRG